MPSYATEARAKAARLIADAALAEYFEISDTRCRIMDRKRQLEDQLARVAAIKLLSQCSLPHAADGGGELTAGSILVSAQYDPRLYTLLTETPYGWVVGFDDGSSERFSDRSLHLLTLHGGSIRLLSINSSGRASLADSQSYSRGYFLAEGSGGAGLPSAEDLQTITDLTTELLPSAEKMSASDKAWRNAQRRQLKAELAQLDHQLESPSLSSERSNELHRASMEAEKAAAHAAMFAFVEDYAMPTHINGRKIKTNQTFVFLTADGQPFVAGAGVPSKLGYAFATRRAGGFELLLERDGQLYMARINRTDELRYRNGTLEAEPVTAMRTAGHDGQMGAGEPRETAVRSLSKEFGTAWQLDGVDYAALRR
jgi:hypothetical protein